MKRQRGRPIAGRQKKRRYQVTLLPSVAKEFSRKGGGNRSLGIALYIAENEALMKSIKLQESALRRIVVDGLKI